MPLENGAARNNVSKIRIGVATAVSVTVSVWVPLNDTTGFLAYVPQPKAARPDCTTLHTFCTFVAGAQTMPLAQPKGGLTDVEHATNA